jgi:hypothetical protein
MPAGEKPEGWKLERGVELQSYAVIEPARTNLNTYTVVLVTRREGAFARRNSLHPWYRFRRRGASATREIGASIASEAVTNGISKPK